MSRATQQTGRYRMRYCAACGEMFTYDSRNARHEARTLCRRCRKAGTTLEDTRPTMRVENRGTIPGGNIRWGVRKNVASVASVASSNFQFPIGHWQHW